jgi:hypothetical protein
MMTTWTVGDKAKLFDYSGRHGDIGRVDHIGNDVILLDLGDCIWPVDPSDLKPVMTFEEMAARRDPLYAATKPVGDFYVAVVSEDTALHGRDRAIGTVLFLGALHDLTIRALRNQGQPYYHRGDE